jgi:hypothetical protein
VVYLDINLAKVAMWLYGYLPGYIDIQIISPTYLDIDIRARISVDIDIRRSVVYAGDSPVAIYEYGNVDIRVQGPRLAYCDMLK